MGLKGLKELPFSFENISSYPFIFPNCTKLKSLDIPASTNQCQGLLDMHTQLRPTKQIIDSLVEIKYTLSILQVYFICTSQKKKYIWSIPRFVLPEKKYKWSTFGKCTSFILQILKYTLSILLQTSVLVKNSFAKKSVL